jgi:hypothetical protein
MVTRRWVLSAAAVAAADLRMNFDARAEETYANKTVFMTSDDGPNAATSTIIDIAERHQVPFTLLLSLVSDFERASNQLGLTSPPVLGRGPGRDVWRLPGMRLDDRAISRNETGIEDLAYDALFAAGFYLYGWDVEWAHRHGIPRQSVPTMVNLLTASRSLCRQILAAMRRA